jgi:DNA-binding transcriptional MerR regulator
MSDGQMFLLPADAAEQLELSPSTLRRYAAAYEDVHEALPRDRQGRRLWTPEALDRLSAAKELLESGAVNSIKAGLERAQHPTDLPERVQLGRDELLAALVAEVQALREEVGELRQKQLEPSETQRMNAYLLGELERRRLEDKVKKERRAWWRFWQRS